MAPCTRREVREPVIQQRHHVGVGAGLEGDDPVGAVALLDDERVVPGAAHQGVVPRAAVDRVAQVVGPDDVVHRVAGEGHRRVRESDEIGDIRGQDVIGETVDENGGAALPRRLHDEVSEVMDIEDVVAAVPDHGDGAGANAGSNTSSPDVPVIQPTPEPFNVATGFTYVGASSGWRHSWRAPG